MLTSSVMINKMCLTPLLFPIMAEKNKKSCALYSSQHSSQGNQNTYSFAV